MELAEILKGSGMVISGGALALIIKLVADIWKARNQRTEITNQPVKVEGVERQQTIEECVRQMNSNDVSHAKLFAMIEKQIETTAALQERIKDIEEIKKDIKELIRRTK